MDEKSKKLNFSKELQNPVGTYRKMDVMTANKETILLMMYSGAIRFLKRALSGMEAGNIEEKTNYITKAQEIITELRSTLNFEAGGAIAKQLEALYAYLSQRLAQGNAENRPEYLQEVLTILNTLNDGWEQAIENLRKERSQRTNVDK